MTYTHDLIMDELVLIPQTLGENFDYLMDLAMEDKYSHVTREVLIPTLKYIKHLWVAEIDGLRSGIAFLTKIDDTWMLHAYRDKVLDKDKLRGLYSYNTGLLVIEWFEKHYCTSKLFTSHHTTNKAATKMCERLGFRQTHTD